jgi:hypothetical protein
VVWPILLVWLVCVFCFGFSGDWMGFGLGSLMGVRVGLRHLGKQLGLGLGFYGGEAVG